MKVAQYKERMIVLKNLIHQLLALYQNKVIIGHS